MNNLNYLIQTLNPEGKITFADIVDYKVQIRHVLDIGDDEPIHFKKGVFKYNYEAINTEYPRFEGDTKYIPMLGQVTEISWQQASKLRLANSIKSV